MTDITARSTSTPIEGVPTEFRLLPAGNFRSTDTRPTDVPSWHIDATIANKIIQQATSATNEILIDYEHQSLNAQANGKPVPAAGWFKLMQWREGDGLYAINVRWTDTATAMLKAREYRYISPTFIYDKKSGDVLSLLSAALTNTPGLDGLTDFGAKLSQQNPTHVNQADEEVNRLLKTFFGPSAVLMNQAPAEALAASARQDDDSEKDAVNALMLHCFGPNAHLR